MQPRSGLSSWPLRSGAAAQVRSPGHWGADPQRHGQQPWVQNSVGLPCTWAGQARTLSSLGRPLALLTQEEPRLPLSRGVTQSALPTRDAPGAWPELTAAGQVLLCCFSSCGAARGLTLTPKPNCGRQREATSCHTSPGGQGAQTEESRFLSQTAGGRVQMSTTPGRTRRQGPRPAWWLLVTDGHQGWETRGPFCHPRYRELQREPVLTPHGALGPSILPSSGGQEPRTHRALGIGGGAPGGLLPRQLLHVAVHVGAEAVGLVEGAAPAGAAALQAAWAWAHGRAALRGLG